MFNIFESIIFAAIAKFFAACTSIVIIMRLVKEMRKNQLEERLNNLAALLLIMLCAKLFDDLNWAFIRPIRLFLFQSPEPPPTILAIVRFSWIAATLQRYFLARFMQLFNQPSKLINAWIIAARILVSSFVATCILLDNI